MIRLIASLMIAVGLALLIPVIGRVAWHAYNDPMATRVARGATHITLPDGTRSVLGAVTALDQRALSAFAETVARPLFFEGRKYPVRAVAAMSPVAPKVVAKPQVYGVDGLRLLGIVSGSGSPRALIEAPPQAASWRMAGDTVQAWTIDTINGNSVRLIRDGQTAMLLLYGFSAHN
jgi:hypothetical protein